MQQIDIKSYNLAPIVLFVYNRLDHTKQTIEALQKNEISNKVIFLYILMRLKTRSQNKK